MSTSSSSSSLTPTQQWHLFIDTCRLIPASDITQLQRLADLYPRSNSSGIIPPRIGDTWERSGEGLLREFDAERLNSERQEKILRQAWEGLRVLMDSRDGGGGGGGRNGGGETVMNGNANGLNGMNGSSSSSSSTPTGGGPNSNGLQNLSKRKRRPASPPNSSLRPQSPALPTPTSHNLPHASSSFTRRSISPLPPPPSSTTFSFPSSQQQPPTLPNHPYGKDWPKRRKELQLPLKPGRKVAYKQNGKGTGLNSHGGGGGGGGGEEGGEGEWILAIVMGTIGNDKTKYIVKDAEPEAENADMQYSTTIRSLLLLPDPTSSPTSLSHPSSYEDFPKQTTVLGLYPGTSVFYKAKVMNPPIPGTGCGRSVTGDPGKEAKRGMYRLRFEDDGDNVWEVGFESVVEYPS